MKILKCTCKHPFQDSLYGTGNRAMNETKSGQYRCTVCSSLIGSQILTTPSKIEKTPQSKPIEKQVTPKEGKKSDEKNSEKKSKKASLKGGKR